MVAPISQKDIDRLHTKKRTRVSGKAYERKEWRTMTIVVNVEEFRRAPIRVDACVGQDYPKMVEAMDALGVAFGWHAMDEPIHSDLDLVTKEVGEIVSSEYSQVSRRIEN